MRIADTSKDAELLESIESTSESQLDEMCHECIPKQVTIFFSDNLYMPLYIRVLNVFSSTSSYSGEEILFPFYR